MWYNVRYLVGNEERNHWFRSVNVFEACIRAAFHVHNEKGKWLQIIGPMADPQ